MQNVREEFRFYGRKRDGMLVSKYLVSPQDKVVVIVVLAVLKGSM